MQSMPSHLPPPAPLPVRSLRNVGGFWMRLAMGRGVGGLGPAVLALLRSFINAAAAEPALRRRPVDASTSQRCRCRRRPVQYIMLCLGIGFVYFQVRQWGNFGWPMVWFGL